MLNTKSWNMASQALLMKAFNTFAVMDASHRIRASGSSFAGFQQIRIYLELWVVVEMARKKVLSCLSTRVYHHTWSKRAAPACSIADTSVCTISSVSQNAWDRQDLPGLNIPLQSSDKQRLKKSRMKTELKK